MVEGGELDKAEEISGETDESNGRWIVSRSLNDSC